MSAAGGGLKFRCTCCGNCCTGPPGFVWVDAPGDEERLAGFLGLDVEEFRLRHTRVVEGRRSLRERRGGDCIFLDPDRLCMVQAAKPRQCLTFPFWPRIVASREAWEERSRTCPGMGHGELFTEEEIGRLTDLATPRPELQRIMEKGAALRPEAP